MTQIKSNFAISAINPPCQPTYECYIGGRMWNTRFVALLAHSRIFRTDQSINRTNIWDIAFSSRCCTLIFNINIRSSIILATYTNNNNNSTPSIVLSYLFTQPNEMANETLSSAVLFTRLIQLILTFCCRFKQIDARARVFHCKWSDFETCGSVV